MKTLLVLIFTVAFVAGSFAQTQSVPLASPAVAASSSCQSQYTGLARCVNGCMATVTTFYNTNLEIRASSTKERPFLVTAGDTCLPRVLLEFATTIARFATGG